MIESRRKKWSDTSTWRLLRFILYPRAISLSKLGKWLDLFGELHFILRASNAFCLFSILLGSDRDQVGQMSGVLPLIFQVWVIEALEPSLRWSPVYLLFTTYSLIYPLWLLPLTQYHLPISHLMIEILGIDPLHQSMAVGILGFFFLILDFFERPARLFDHLRGNLGRCLHGILERGLEGWVRRSEFSAMLVLRP